MKPIRLREQVYWVGGIDWNLRDFHGYLTQKGTTYNAYLVIDEKITLIDTVKEYLCQELIERISSLVDPSKIDYIITNHVEMDHSGSLPEIIKLAPQATIFASPQGEKGLKAHYKKDWNIKKVKSGETLNLGKRNLHFLQTPLVHWPDNMVSYMPEEKILFSNDAFGQHIASSERFDDQYPLDIILEEAQKYYANIVFPYGKQVKKALESASQLEIEMIAPSHGLIWRKNLPSILEEYKKWSDNETDEKAVVVFDTMWGSTGKIARAIQKAFENREIKVVMKNLKYNHISDIMTEVITSRYICVGSPTLNNGILPSVSSFLTYMKGLSPKKRKGLAFGSYGWSGESVGVIEEVLRDCGFDLFEQVRLQYIPDDSNLNEIEEKIKESI
ncbi:MAG: FprA family A-type flavoprotein [Candidatus Syntrophonatronum acetioxidans]|uniref:FprA family A-type flavoprotein n=1 Tax=Candidatus Syntrophonatronum acetioxidans TaxID=1795816 RepID=A0A424YGG8_9FIRM|nr:MAG: FprA family A-type flavoprotein [Candidatus Syntrophonatronum acetioxidans]